MSTDKSTRATRMPHNTTGLATYSSRNSRQISTNRLDSPFPCANEIITCNGSSVDCMSCLTKNFPNSANFCSGICQQK